MGAALWFASALSVFFVARIIPPGRPHNYLSELIIAVVTAVTFGVLATILDFGGWRDADWRASTFALLAASAAIGAHRALRLARE
jgi:hypothetical protein